MRDMKQSRFEVFIDAETLSEDSLTAPVVDFSAMIIDREKMISDNPYNMRDISLVKYFKLDTKEQIMRHKAVTSEHTLEFWKKQPKEVRKRIMPSEDDLSVELFVNKFISFLGTEPTIGRVWSRNISFDIILLKRLFKMTGKNLDAYIEHYFVRDIRTAIDVSFGFDINANSNFAPVKDEVFWNKVFQPHNSTWDVIADVLRYQAILRTNADLEQINR